MAKAILMSIQPKWCEKIASGEKTIEVRKTRPKLETPFKVYIYATKAVSTNTRYYMSNIDLCRTAYNGKVIGEFVCDRISEYANGEIALSHNTDETCLTNCELADYIEGSKAYFWHISDLKKYDKPKDLSEFFTPIGKRPSYMIERPPQSYMFVEDLEDLV